MIKCPEAMTKVSEDNSVDICNISSKFCILMSQDSCPYYDDYLDSITKEEVNNDRVE